MRHSRGSEQPREAAEFGEQRRDWLAGFAPLPCGIASDDTFARVFRPLADQARREYEAVATSSSAAGASATSVSTQA